MALARKTLVALVVVAVAGVGGYGAARALSTDGPEPTVDSPVVVRPANDGADAGERDGKGADDPAKERARPDQRPGGDSHRVRQDGPPKSKRDGNGGRDKVSPARPSPNTFDDDDDRDDRDDDDGDDDDGDDD